MTPATNMTKILIAAVALVAVGAAGAVMVQRVFFNDMPPMPATGGVPAPAAAPPSATATTVTLSPELLARAGIRTAPVRTGRAVPTWRAPGSVEANAYGQVAVTPVAAGQVTAVMIELGQSVTEGQTLVEIYSPELAEAERDYLSTRADLELASERRQRTEKLTGIGAVSRQELEDVRAEYARRNNAVEGARARLRLLGLTPETIATLVSASDIAAVVRVPAPSAGVVLKRAVNRGQNVDTKMELITIADLSSVWVIADVYERDMARVRIGGQARVTSVSLPGEAWTGRVAYLDPQVATETRTLKARIEVANPRRALMPGMLVDVALTTAAGAATVLVPRAAVQQIGGRTIVFLPDASAAGRFTPREVQLGTIMGDDVEVVSGVSVGDQVVTDGGFALKAEWARIGGRVPPLMEAPASTTAPAERVMLQVTEDGFVPNRVQVSAGRPIELVVTRTTDKTCGTEILIGNARHQTKLPLNQAVSLHLEALPLGELKFTCGMAMLKGTIVAR